MIRPVAALVFLAWGVGLLFWAWVLAVLWYGGDRVG